MKVAVIFDNLGPYHLARLRAAAQECELLAVEVSGNSLDHAWERKTELGNGQSEDKEEFNIITLFEKGMNSDSACMELTSKLNLALNSFLPQTVFIPGWSSRVAFVALDWCMRHRIPAIMMSESTEWDEERNRWREFVKRRIINRCSAALVGGGSHKDYIRKLGMPDERIFLGYDAVDNKYFKDNAEAVKRQKSKLREQYGLPKDYFLASARFIEKKNLIRLLEAYSEYRAIFSTLTPDRQETKSESDPSCGARDPYDLVLLGTGILHSDIHRIITELQLGNSVLLPGFIQYPHLPVYYGLANAFIHASTTEQWGLVVNEAMASGLPVLVSNRCGCAQELVHEGVNGFTFDPYNVERLTQLMLKISVSNFPLSVFGDASREIIADWGTERFGSGLKAAAECGVKVGGKPSGVLDWILLRTLIRIRK